jgi:hypothetical protein
MGRDRATYGTASSNFFLVLWSRYASDSPDSIYQLVLHGLADGLTSADQMRVLNTLHLCAKLTEFPGFFVDIYMNFDCHRSQRFAHVFESIVLSISKFAQPNDAETEYARAIAVDVALKLLRIVFEFRSADARI